MARQRDVRRIALSLPGVRETEGRFAFTVLVRLPAVRVALLRKLPVEAWRCQAPRELLRDDAASRPRKRRP